VLRVFYGFFQNLSGMVLQERDVLDENAHGTFGVMVVVGVVSIGVDSGRQSWGGGLEVGGKWRGRG